MTNGKKVAWWQITFWGIVTAVSSYVHWYYFLLLSSIWTKGLFLLLSLLWCYLCLTVLVYPLRKIPFFTSIFSQLRKITLGPIMQFMGILTIIFVFGSILLFQYLIWIIVVVGLHLPVSGQLVTYFVFLFTFLVFAYYGDKAIGFFSRITDEEVKDLSHKQLVAFQPRRRVYELVIVVTLLGNIEKFTGLSILQWLFGSFSSVSNEVLVTFMAVDRYISNYRPKILERQIRKSG